MVKVSHMEDNLLLMEVNNLMVDKPHLMEDNLPMMAKEEP